jgi:hypothetical protein
MCWQTIWNPVILLASVCALIGMLNKLILPKGLDDQFNVDLLGHLAIRIVKQQQAHLPH